MRSTRGLRLGIGILVLAARLPVAAGAAEPAKRLTDDPGVASAIQVFDLWVARTAADREQPGVSIGIVHDQDLIWAKEVNDNGGETSTPIQRNPNFGNIAGRYSPFSARFGVRLSF